MKTNRQLRVFICHSSQDKPIVRELYNRLLAEEWLDPWLDEEKLLPGQNWNIEIEKATEATDAVIVCLSSNSITKEGYIQRELNFVLDIALEKPEDTIFIIPLRLDECKPPRRLRSWQYVDYFPISTRENSFSRLLVSLRSRALSLGLENDIEQIQNNNRKEDVRNTILSLGTIKSKDGLSYSEITNNKLIIEKLPNNILNKSIEEE